MILSFNLSKDHENDVINNFLFFFPFCNAHIQKSLVSTGGNTVYSRACLPICTETSTSEGALHCCSSDYCNGASDTRPKVSVVLSFCVIAVVMLGGVMIKETCVSLRKLH